MRRCVLILMMLWSGGELMAQPAPVHATGEQSPVAELRAALGVTVAPILVLTRGVDGSGGECLAVTSNVPWRLVESGPGGRVVAEGPAGWRIAVRAEQGMEATEQVQALLRLEHAGPAGAGARRNGGERCMAEESGGAGAGKQK